MARPNLVRIDYGKQLFSFEIHERDVFFGSAGSGTYFWMDSRQLRKGRGGPNFRPCVDFWWRTVEQHNATPQIDDKVNLVLAECYPLVNTARAVQNIYTDAHLHQMADREYDFVEENNMRRRRSERTYLLPDDECDRLRQIAHSRDMDQIRKELERLFLGELPPREEMPAYVEAAQSWIGKGIDALESGGRQGLNEYLPTVDKWIRTLRRRGGQDRVRRFLNMFAYECKVSFHICYASAWVGILQWVQQRRAPNTLGERFMQLWHHHNLPPDRSVELGGTSRGVFCGQVLALHPLSGIILTSPQHLQVIGIWIGHPEYQSILEQGKAASYSEYWDFVTTILIAAHEYYASKKRWEESRGQVTYSDHGAVSCRTRDDAEPSASLQFEDYAASRKIVCPQCAKSLAYVRHELPTSSYPAAKVHFRCCSCEHQQILRITMEDMTAPQDNE